MPLIIAAVFLAVPIIEIALLIQVGGLIGVWRTVALVVLTAVIGAWLLRREGLRTLTAAQESLARNEMPVTELFDGACLLLAGALLLTPGFFTDTIGFLLFLPPLRAALRRWLAGWVAARQHTTIIIDGQVMPDGGGRSDNDSRTIEGRYREVEDDRDREDDDPAPPGGNGRWGRRH